MSQDYSESVRKTSKFNPLTEVPLRALRFIFKSFDDIILSGAVDPTDSRIGAITENFKIGVKGCNEATRAAIAATFAEFLSNRLGDKIKVDSNPSSEESAHIKTHLKTDKKTASARYSTINRFDVNLIAMAFYANQFPTFLKDKMEDQFYVEAVESQLTKIVNLMGGSVQSGGYYHTAPLDYSNPPNFVIFSANSFYANEMKTQAITQMKLIDEKLPEIKTEIEHLIKLGKGEVLPDSIIQKRERENAPKPQTQLDYERYVNLSVISEHEDLSPEDAAFLADYVEKHGLNQPTHLDAYLAEKEGTSVAVAAR